MKPRKQALSSAGGWFLLALGLLAGGYWLQLRPVEVRTETACPDCRGSGRGECRRCEGFGTVDIRAECPKCKGSGKTPLKFGHHPRNAPCMRCGGTGTVAARGACPGCAGSGLARCAACGGRGTVAATARNRTVVLGESPWERLRLRFQLPIARNPRPQRGLLGGYALIDRYLALRSGGAEYRVRARSDFEPAGRAWRMTADVETPGPDGTPRRQRIEFTVRDRVLAARGAGP